jgi:hypothetical protein
MLSRFTRLTSVARPALETTFKNTRNFCVFAAYLDPKAHITMSHNPHNVYEDIVMMGDYLLPTKEMTRVISQKYKPELINIAFSVLNEKFPQAGLNAENYEDLIHDSWKALGVDIDAAKTDILERWAEEIFVTEHKLRYPVEQRIRLSYTSSIYSSFDFENYRIAFFFDLYNSWLNLSIDRSHLFRSPKVKGDTSFLEKYLQDQTTTPTGVDVLKRDAPENKNFINRLMNYIHS